MGFSFDSQTVRLLAMFTTGFLAVLIQLSLVGCAEHPEALYQKASPNRSAAFVHLFEWSWQDVALECEQWLGPKGFTAVQISPPNDHMTGSQWWTRYQPVTYELTSRSGDSAAFADMVKRCKKVGVGIYADAVFNHIASGSGTSIAGKSYGNRATPIYSPDDMHHDAGNVGSNCMVSNYDDKHNVQYCDLVGLPDLCTSCEKVQKTVAAYINHMIDIGIDGFRIDAAKHMDNGELKQLLSNVKNHAWRFQEVISGAGEAVKPEMYLTTGEVTEFAYPSLLSSNILQDGKMKYLESFGASWGMMNRDSAVVFLDNHDTQRGNAALTYKSGKYYELANVFMLAHPYGYPKVMSSYYFDNHDQGPPSTPVHSSGNVKCGSGSPWVCEHRWPALANMIAWRHSAGAADVSHFQVANDNTVAFCRGASACVALNRQESPVTVTFIFTLPAGSYCDVIQSDDVSKCPTLNIPEGGSVSVQIPALGAVAAHIGKKVNATDSMSIQV
jgi:alpha-amylase